MNTADLVVSLIVIVTVSWIVWLILKGLFKLLVETFKFAGGLIPSLLIGFIVLLVSANVFDAAHAQAALQAGGVTLALTALASSQMGI